MAHNRLYKDILRCLKKHAPVSLSGHSLRRIQTLSSMVYAIISSKKSGIYAISSKLQGSHKQSESRVKQAKRWLDSKWTDFQTHFACYTVPVLSSLASKGELVVSIDGSEVGQNCICLMLSAYYRRRAIPIAWVVRKGKKGHFPEQMHIDLIESASSLIPKGCRVVLLGDGEFSGSKLIQAIQQLEWQYALRTKLNRRVDFGSETAPIGSACVPKGHKSLFVPNALPCSNAVLWHEKRFERPIPLLTNMEVGWVACLYYKKRFSIETMFSDIKSRGFNLHKAQMSNPKRVEKLMIAVALAYLMVFLWGLAEVRQDFVNKVYRQDRKDKHSPFNLGLKQAQYCIENHYSIFSLISKNLNLFFCVRS